MGRVDARAGGLIPETESTCAWPPAQVPPLHRKGRGGLEGQPRGRFWGEVEVGAWARGRGGRGAGRPHRGSREASAAAVPQLLRRMLFRVASAEL